MSVCPLFISEIAPVDISGTLGVINNFMCICGLIVAYFLGFLAPYTDDSDVETNEIWRMVFGFPVIATILQFTLFSTIFNLDTPAYYKSVDDNITHDRVMAKIYEDYEDGKSLFRFPF